MKPLTRPKYAVTIKIPRKIVRQMHVSDRRLLGKYINKILCLCDLKRP